MKKLNLLFILVFLTGSLFPQSFTKKVLLDNTFGREADWGDFDRDGDPDILMFYISSGSHTSVFENKSGTFSDLGVALPIVESSDAGGAANWFDYNNDGLLDICLIKNDVVSAKIKILKKNGDKTFTDIKCDSVLAIVPGSCGPSFADYDNDGDLDILLMGTSEGTFINQSLIYENSGNGKFVDSKIMNITGIIKSRMPWGDFNNDGYMDILANETLEDGTSIIVIYKNNGNKTFTKQTFSYLQGLNDYTLGQAGDMRWGDYNSDGFTDILISGQHTGSSGAGVTKLYKNNGDRTFQEINISNVYALFKDVNLEWGDYNNDGILDILQTGDGWIYGVAGKTRIFYNNKGAFEKEADDSFLGIHQWGMSTAADYDNDGDLDILDLGADSYIQNQIALFDNLQPVKNTKPTAPSNLRVEYQNKEVILKWDRATDIETTAAGLSYNVYLTKDLNTIVAPAALESGKRTIVAVGNAQYNTMFKINNLSSGNYKWSVQSIDNCYEGSEFATENTFNYKATGIEDVANGKPKIRIYPNPISDLLTIESTTLNTNECNIDISDLTGRHLIKANSVLLPFSINTTSLNAGVFLVTVYQKNNVFVGKILKQ